jgi:hypothetical protein
MGSARLAICKPKVARWRITPATTARTSPGTKTAGGSPHTEERDLSAIAAQLPAELGAVPWRGPTKKQLPLFASSRRARFVPERSVNLWLEVA